MGVPTQSALSGPQRREAGVALASAMFGLVAVSLLITGVFVMTDLQSRAGANRVQAARALHVAEAGLSHATATLRTNLTLYGFTRLLRGSDNVASTADDGRLVGYALPAGTDIPAAGRVAAGGTYYVQILDDPADAVANPLVDGNNRLLLRCRGTTVDGASAEIEAIITTPMVPGVASGGNLEISSAAVVTGACAGVHANGSLTGGGNPTVEGGWSATGSIPGGFIGPKAPSSPAIEIPVLNPTDYCAVPGVTYITGTFTLSSATLPGIYCVTGNVQSSGDFGTWATAKAISIIATGSIQISTKPFIKAAHPDGILLLAGGDFDSQGDWGGQGLIYAGGHCYVSAKPTILGGLTCAGRPDPAGAIDYTDNNLISGDAQITIDCAGLYNKRRVLFWYPRLGA